MGTTPRAGRPRPENPGRMKPAGGEALAAAGLFPEPTGWTAWRQAGAGRWEEVGHGDTEAEAGAVLVRVMATARTGSYSSVVLPAGEYPPGYRLGRR